MVRGAVRSGKAHRNDSRMGGKDYTPVILTRPANRTISPPPGSGPLWRRAPVHDAVAHPRGGGAPRRAETMSDTFHLTGAPRAPRTWEQPMPSRDALLHALPHPARTAIRAPGCARLGPHGRAPAQA
jgi:hypothetical protein